MNSFGTHGSQQLLLREPSSNLKSKKKPQVCSTSSIVWRVETELEDAKRDLVCESVRGMMQHQGRAGIGLGTEETLGEVGSAGEMGRVKKNIERERGRFKWDLWRSRACGVSGESS